MNQDIKLSIVTRGLKPTRKPKPKLVHKPTPRPKVKPYPKHKQNTLS